MILPRSEIETACAEINLKGSGRVQWTRKTESTGSGKARKEGQRDWYDITAARLDWVPFGRKDAPVFHLMLVITLAQHEVDANIANGGSARNTRNLNPGTIRTLKVA